MLAFLHIRHLALLDRAELDFGPGFTAVTGETGAGKSILLGALNLLAGARAEKSIIQTGADACEVEAGLHLPESSPIHAALEELGLPACEEGLLLLRRTVARERLSRVQINGASATVANLQALGQHWIDFHGPGESEHLFQEGRQLELLDLFAKNGERLLSYQKHYSIWRDRLAELDELESATALSPEEAAFLQRELERLGGLDLTPDGITGLERDFSRLDRAEELARAIGVITEGLDDDSDGVIVHLGRMLQEARSIAEGDTEAASLASRLESLVIESEDLAAAYRELTEGLEFDEEQAADLRERMEDWLYAKRKYGPGLEQVLTRAEEMRQRLALQGDLGERRETLQAAIEVQRTKVNAAGEKLREARKRAASQLGREAEKLLGGLGFKAGRVKIEVLDEPEPREHGDSRCRFLFSANPGQPLLPLRKAASSGETARLMLALKTALAAADATPVLVFDEVDANIGGEIAIAVAARLKELGASHQVLCVTHLPQVAAQAQGHFLVEKATRGQSTSVTVTPIDPDRQSRVSELARMLGDRAGKTAMEHAAALLDG